VLVSGGCDDKAQLEANHERCIPGVNEGGTILLHTINDVARGAECLKCKLEVVTTGTVPPGEEKARGDLIKVYKYLMGGSREDGAGLFAAVPSERQKGSASKLKHRKFHLNIRKCAHGRWAGTR